MYGIRGRRWMHIGCSRHAVVGDEGEDVRLVEAANGPLAVAGRVVVERRGDRLRLPGLLRRVALPLRRRLLPRLLLGGLLGGLLPALLRRLLLPLPEEAAVEAVQALHRGPRL